MSPLRSILIPSRQLSRRIQASTFPSVRPWRTKSMSMSIVARRTSPVMQPMTTPPLTVTLSASPHASSAFRTMSCASLALAGALA